MINSVSSVSFRANAPADIISRPGAYAIVDADPKAPKKGKHKVLKGVAIALGTAAVVSGALIYGSKGGKWFKPIEGELKDAKLMDKISHYLNKAGSKLDEKVWTPIVNLFKKGKGETAAAEEATAKAETVAEEVAAKAEAVAKEATAKAETVATKAEAVAKEATAKAETVAEEVAAKVDTVV